MSDGELTSEALPSFAISDHQIDHARAVAPLVVVPGHDLEEVRVQLDAGAGVVMLLRVADEIAGDDLVFRVAEDALDLASLAASSRR